MQKDISISQVNKLIPTGGFRWLTRKEISKIDSEKYKTDGKKGSILEVDLEYPKELHDLHDDYSVAPEKVKVSKNMLSEYCKKIAERYFNRSGKQTNPNVK